MPATTPSSVDEVTPRSREFQQHHVVLMSTLIPVCVIAIVLGTIWKKKRRIRKISKSVKTTVYIIPNNYFPKSSLIGPNFTQDNPPQIKETKKPKSLGLHLKIAQKSSNNANLLTGTFPRDPVYKSQESPSYIVPFTALPRNFDFSLKNVEVHSDFVVIKDLDILHSYWYETNSPKEEYKKQSPYNFNC